MFRGERTMPPCRIHVSLLAAAFLGLLSGCEHFPPLGQELPQDRQEHPQASQTPEGKEQTPDVGELVNYFRRVQHAPKPDLERRALDLSSRMTEGKCDVWRLKYTMVTMALAPPGGAPKPQKLLGACLDSDLSGEGGLQGLAYLLEELWQTQAVSLQYRSQLAETRRRLDNAQAQTAKLREQLEGLKAIEQSIQQRDREKGATESQ